MKLELVELEVNWPNCMVIQKLRKLILNEIRNHGEPIRWAITSSEASSNSEYFRTLQIEAVVLVSND